MNSTHTSREYEVELREVRGSLLAMSARCERALQLAVEIALDRDVSRIDEVFALDTKIDQDEIDIDDLVLQILARRQPVAYDLRFLATTLKFVTDLERIGDKAVGIARRARELATAKDLPSLTKVSELHTRARGMLREALDAFVEGSTERADAVRGAEAEMNALYKAVHAEVVEWIRTHPNDVVAGLAVINVLRALERVADHATNLAEQVVFMVRGDDVRHRPPPDRKRIDPESKADPERSAERRS